MSKGVLQALSPQDVEFLHETGGLVKCLWCWEGNGSNENAALEDVFHPEEECITIEDDQLGAGFLCGACQECAISDAELAGDDDADPEDEP